MSHFVREENRMPFVSALNFMPVAYITHIRENGDGISAKKITGLGINSTPANLAELFLEFVSDGTVRYTEEELEKMTGIITAIHQRQYDEH